MTRFSISALVFIYTYSFHCKTDFCLNFFVFAREINISDEYCWITQFVTHILRLMLSLTLMVLTCSLQCSFHFWTYVMLEEGKVIMEANIKNCILHRLMQMKCYIFLLLNSWIWCAYAYFKDFFYVDYSWFTSLKCIWIPNMNVLFLNI